MVNFYRINSHMKYKSWIFSWTAISLYILSVHVLFCSARPYPEETSAEKAIESDADVVKTNNELPPETEKTIEEFIQKEQDKHNEKFTDYQEPDPTDAEDVGEEVEDPAGDDYPVDEVPIKSFTELKTPPPPTTRRPHRVYSEADDDDDTEGEVLEEDQDGLDETIPATTSTTTEEPTTMIEEQPRISEIDFKNNDSSESETSTIEISTSKTNKGLMLRNYSFVLFISVLLCIIA